MRFNGIINKIKPMDKTPDKLPEEMQEQINNEADLYGFVVPYDGSNTFYIDDKVKGYQAGATAWAAWKVRYDELQAQAQRMADALEELIVLKRMKDELGKTTNYLTRQPAAWKRATEELQQFKDGKRKEVGPVKPVASNCGMCGKLGINQYLGNQLYLCDECFEDYEKGRDQPEIN